jgi:hypothetical protein
MNKERLLKTAELLARYALEDNPDVAFNMATWATINYSAPLCGTSACAVGLAALDPWFQDQGLELISGSWRIHTRAELVAVLEKKSSSLRLVPGFNGKFNHYAVKDFYDLNMEEVQFLFGPENPNDPFLIASNIYHFVTMSPLPLKVEATEPKRVEVQELEPAE